MAESLIKPFASHLGFSYIRFFSLGTLLNLIDSYALVSNLIWCSDVHFHLKVFEFSAILLRFLMDNIHLYFTDHAFSPRLSLPLLFSLTISKKKREKKRNTSRKSFLRENKTLVHVGMEPSKTDQTRWEQHHNTFTPSLHLVPFHQLCFVFVSYLVHGRQWDVGNGGYVVHAWRVR